MVCGGILRQRNLVAAGPCGGILRCAGPRRAAVNEYVELTGFDGGVSGIVARFAALPWGFSADLS